MLFIVVSSTIGVFLVERESRVAALSPEQNIFSEVRTIQIFKSLQGTLRCLTLDLQMRYIVASALTDRQTDTQNDYCNPTVHAPRVNEGARISISFLTIPYS